MERFKDILARAIAVSAILIFWACVIWFVYSAICVLRITVGFLISNYPQSLILIAIFTAIIIIIIGFVKAVNWAEKRLKDKEDSSAAKDEVDANIFYKDQRAR